jgi:creatinine amidohydrolase/Fe(II)-dependent formamide hydrolase-like protein
MVKRKTYLLEELTWNEARDLFKKTDIAIVNLGAIHPHGTGAPLGTDVIGAFEVAERINKKCVDRGNDVVILPTIPFGYNYYHGDFEGTISIDKPTLISYYWNVVKWLHKWGIKKLIWNSPHAGNSPCIEEVATRARTELGMFSVRFAWDGTGMALTRDGVINTPIKRGDEGLILEMSLVAAVKPDIVDFSQATFKDYEQPFGDVFSVVDAHTIEFGKSKVYTYMGTRDVTSTGGYGAPENRDYSKASAESGKIIVDGVVNYIVDFIEEFKKLKIPSKYYGKGF